jgi:hypothetical protein
MARQPSRILDLRLRNFLEKYERALGDAFDQVTEGLSGEIESMVEEYGAPEVGHLLSHYPITLRLDRTLLEAFGPAVADSWGDEE